MAKLRFITSGAIDYQLLKMTLYESIQITGLGRVFPSLRLDEIQKIQTEFCPILDFIPDLIISAPSLQANETAKSIADYFGKKVLVSDELLPLTFDIENFMSEEEFDRSETKFDDLRKKFLKAFFQDTLCESKFEIRYRFRRILKLVKKHPNRSILIVSHAFLIKFFEIYIKFGDRMFCDFKLLEKEFNPNQAPYGRLEGFEVIL